MGTGDQLGTARSWGQLRPKGSWGPARMRACAKGMLAQKLEGTALGERLPYRLAIRLETTMGSGPLRLPLNSDYHAANSDRPTPILARRRGRACAFAPPRRRPLRDEEERGGEDTKYSGRRPRNRCTYLLCIQHVS